MKICSVHRHPQRSTAMTGVLSVLALLAAGLVPLATAGPAAADPTTTPTQLVFTTQPGDGAPGSALAAQPVVTAEDATGATVTGSSATIDLTLTQVGTQVKPPVTLTCAQTGSGGSTSVAASSGVATFSGCSVPRGGVYTLTASDDTDGLTVTSAQFFVSGPASLAVTGWPTGGAPGATLPGDPQVTILDGHGNPLTGSTASIYLGIVPGTGSAGAALGCAENPVDAVAGVATFPGCTIDTAGHGYQLGAADITDGFISAPSAPFDLAAGSPARLVFSDQPHGGSGGTTFSDQPVVTVQDAAGNVVTGNTDRISLAIEAGSGSDGAQLSCSDDGSGNAVSAVAGVATFSGCAIDAAGTGYRLVATDSTRSLTADSTPFDVAAGGVSSLRFATEPSGGPAGAGFTGQPRVTVTDPGGNPVSAPVTLAIKSGSGTSGATLTCDANPVTTAAGGTATFAGCSIDKTGSGYILTATAGGVSIDSAPFDITAGAVASLTFVTEPGDGTGGLAWSTQPVVQLADAGGHAAAGSVTLALTPGLGSSGATLSCEANPVAGVHGTASFAGCSVDKAGSYTLTATSGSAVATSAPFTIRVGSPDHLDFTTQPGGGTGGTDWNRQPVVTVRDAGGNLITTGSLSTTTITLTVTSGTGSGSLTCTANALPAVRGVARFTGCAIDRTAAAYTLTATDTADHLTVASKPFGVTAGAAAGLQFTRQPSGGPAGVPFATQPAVTVVDAGGNPVTDSTASIGLSLTPGTGPGTGHLSCDATSKGVSSGVAAFAGCTVDTAAGGYAVTATDAGDGLSAESLPFTVAAPPPAPLGRVPVGVPAGQTMGGQTYGINPTDTIDHVNTATGALTFAVTDLRVAGIGEPLVVARTYNSNDTTGGVFGVGWTSLLDAGVTILNRHTAIVRGEDGQQLVYTKASNGNAGHWSGPAGARADLQCTAKTCTLTRFDGVQLTLARNADGTSHLVAYRAPDREGLSFSWSSRTVTITVDTTNPSPYQVVAGLDSSGHVTTISTPAHRSVSYGYAGGLLASVTDADGNTWTYGYSHGLLTSQTDPTGVTRLTATYGAGTSRVTAVILAGSPQHADDTFSWDAATKTATIKSSATVGGTLTRVVSTDRYLDNVLVEQSGPDGGITRYSYDDNVDMTEIQDPMGWVQQLAYTRGDLTSQSIPTGDGHTSTVQMTYDWTHRLTSQTDPNGNTIRYAYSGAFLTTITPPDADGAITLSYNNSGLLTEVAGPTSTQQFGYDAAGNRTSVVTLDSAGKPVNGNGTAQSYDEAGNLVSSTTAVGTTTGPAADYTTTWKYDANGNLLATTAPGPRTTRYSYDEAGDLASATDPSGATTSYSWDENTLTRTLSGPSGSTVLTYDPSGNLLAQTSPTGQGTHDVYNAAGEPVATTSADGVTVRQTWDLTGNPVLVTDSAGNTVSREFDAQGREIRRVTNGAVTLTGYDPAGNVVSSTDPDGNVTTATYTPAGQVASVRTAAGTTVYGYDAAGDLTSVTDPDGNTTAYDYRAPGRRTSMTVAAGTALAAATTYTHDADGRLISTTDPDGRVTTETLDAAGDPTRTVSSQSGRPDVTVTRGYDPLGRLQTMTDGTGTHTYTYDSAGNMVQVDGPQGTFSYDYSTPGVIAETYPDGTQITDHVDDAGNLMTLQAGTPGQPGYVAVGYRRNAQRQTTAIAYSNGVLQTRTLDQQGNIVGQRWQTGTGQLAQDSFTYDANGNPLTQSITADGQRTLNQYGYDGAGRVTSFDSDTSTVTAPADQPDTSAPALRNSAGALVAAEPVPTVMATQAPTSALAAAGSAPQLSALVASTAPSPSGAAASQPSGTAQAAGLDGIAAQGDPTFTYDGAGNLTAETSASGTITSQYNARGELTSSTGPDGTTTYRYDARGDLTAVTGPDRSQSLAYDAADRLISVTTTDGGTATTVDYAYDGDGNRVSSTVNGQTIQYVWDPAGAYPRLALERTAAGGLIRRYLYGEGPVAMQTPAGTYFYQVDPSGNVTGITDGSGHLVAAYRYDPYGRVTVHVPAGANPPDNPLLFQGQYRDPDTGLYDMRARTYDPATGRFTQPDPITPAATSAATSPYVFADDNPLVNADPTGQTSVKGLLESVFWGSSDTFRNVANDVKYGIKAANGLVKLGRFAAKQLGNVGDSAAEEVASNLGRAAEPASEVAGEAGELAAGAGEAGEAVASVSTLGKFANAGGAVAVVGFALQTYVTVQDCRSGKAYTCAGDVVGEAVGIAFFVGCTALTEGTAAIACSIAGAIISTGLQEVVTYFGPQIYSGLVSGYNAASAALVSASGQTVQAFRDAGDAIAGFSESAGGAIATGFNQATTAISSGFDGMVSTLVGAGDSAAELGRMLADTFASGADDVAATLIGFGYDVSDVATALSDEFAMGADEAAALFRDGYGYTASAVAGALKDAYHLSDQAAAAVLDGAGYAAGQVASALQDAYHDTMDQAAVVLHGLYGAASDGLAVTTAALQQAYQATDHAIATTLKALGYTATEVAGQLRSLYDEADQAAASALRAAGYAATAVGNALKTAYDDGAQAAATVLKAIGFAAGEVAGALKDAYQATDAVAAQVLRAVGFAADQVAGALQDAYDDAGQAVAVALRAAGYAVDEVAGALHTVFSIGDQAVANLLAGAGYAANQVANAIKQVFSDGDAVVAGILKTARYTVDQVASAVGSAFNEGAAAVAQAMKSAGYVVTDISRALSDVFDRSADQVASLLKSMSYGASQVTGALVDVYGLGASTVASTLQQAGYTASEVAGVLQDTFGEAASTIYNTLKGLYDADALKSISDDVVSGWHSFTSAVSSAWDTVSSWF